MATTATSEPRRGVPPASDEPTRRRMQTARRRDTAPEIALRQELHRRGLRFYVHRRPLASVRRHADVLFPRARVAVYVDGCFWHACPQHGTSPQRNASWWAEKLAANVARDRDTDARLAASGWVAVRVWEHEDSAEAATRVEGALSARRKP